VNRTELAEAAWNHMFLEERPVLHVYKVKSKALAVDDSVDIDELCDGLDQMHLPEDFQYDEDQAWELEHEMEFLHLGQVEDDLDELSQDEDAYSMEL
uniref:Uncharacterized protein n=1 Tax=Acrobeloides nanus TaxID=290746 RepID=A0A914DK03_9BILA